MEFPFAGRVFRIVEKWPKMYSSNFCKTEITIKCLNIKRERERQRVRKRNVSCYVVQLKPVPQILSYEGELITFRF